MENANHLLPQATYYKANLHTYSTISDGEIPLDEVKALYKSKGYQILAMTDHNAMTASSRRWKRAISICPAARRSPV